MQDDVQHTVFSAFAIVFFFSKLFCKAVPHKISMVDKVMTDFQEVNLFAHTINNVFPGLTGMLDCIIQHLHVEKGDKTEAAGSEVGRWHWGYSQQYFEGKRMQYSVQGCVGRVRSLPAVAVTAASAPAPAATPARRDPCSIDRGGRSILHTPYVSMC